MFKYVIFALLIASAVAAPAETPAGQASTEATSTSPASSPSTAAPATETTQAPTSQSAPATDDSAKEQNTTSPMNSAQEPMVNASSFSCYGRAIGYYADIELDCKVYHFCLLGDYNGDPVYQRISYLCLNNTIFDQQALDCVEMANTTAPCKESSNFYDISNTILRQSIVGNKQQGETDTAKNATTSS